MLELVRAWWEHEKWAMERTSAAFMTVPLDRQDEASFQRATDTLSHMVLGRVRNLPRVNVEFAPGIAGRAGLSVEDVVVEWGRVQPAWDAWYGSLDEGELMRPIAYQSEDGRWRMTLADLLSQMFMHAAHHRGQINLLLSELGGTPEDTDYVFYRRERVV